MTVEPINHSARLRARRLALRRHSLPARRGGATQARIDQLRSTARWQSVRDLQLQEQPLCESCLAGGHTTPATQVDHVVPLRVRPDLAFDLANLQSICVPCHALKSARERQA